MKKINKKNQMRMRFSTLLLCILAIVLCATPRGWAFSMKCTEDGVDVYKNGISVFYYEDEDGEYDITEQLIEQLINTAPDEAGLDEGELLETLDVGAGATVNLDTDAQSVYVYPGGILNIYSGSVGWFVVLTTTTGEQDPIVMVYGTNFSVDGVPIGSSKQFTVDVISGGVLTGTYGNNKPIPSGLFTSGLWFISSIPIYLMEPAVSEVEIDEVEIDIKPDSELNKINLKSNGVIPVAVLTTGDFDAIDVDPATVVLAGASHVRWTMEDVDNDGKDDMLFHFKTQDLNLGESITEAADVTETTETTLTLTGKKTDLKVIQGTDKVRIVRGKK